MRDRVLRVAVFLGVGLLLITETLSVFQALTRAWVLLGWLVCLATLVVVTRVRRTQPVTRPPFAFDPVITLCATGIFAIFTLTTVTAAFSPPNSADAMAYHLPRVIYWAEQHSVRFFPTGYMAQIMLQPLTEYLMLHLYVLTGSDRLINFVQWFSALGCMITVSAIAGCLGTRRRGQWLAALFCATLPSGILASSGAKNDYFMSLWLVLAIYFAFRLVTSSSWEDAVFLGAACGLALYTKATAYLFAPWIILAVLTPPLMKSPRRTARFAGGAACLALALNTPQYVRNFNLSGSPLGFQSVQGDNSFRFRNEVPGWKPTVSNLLRNAGEQLGGRSERWNLQVYHAIERLHQLLGINVNDPGTTWQWATYHPPRNANHEADAPNRLHLLILLALAAFAFARALGGHDRRRLLYFAAVALGYVAFCGWLKWQPFMARLFLPLFVAASPLAGAIEEIITPTLLQLAACLLFLDAARLPTLENWVRPLRGPTSVLRVDRDTQYFADMSQWNNAASYREASRLLSAGRCGVIGLDLSHNHLEYPLLALLREHNPAVQFVHTGVTNQSTRYQPPIAASPCAVVCLECAGDNRHLSQYANFPISTIAGKFVILTREPDSAR